MHAHIVIDESVSMYQFSSMVIITGVCNKNCKICTNEYYTSFNSENFPDEEILKRFSENKNTNSIVICGIEPNNISAMVELRSFIFSARKFFEPNNRPLLIIYTYYYFEELQDLGWAGVYAELLQYGNVILKCGRGNAQKDFLYFYPDLGIKLRGKNQDIHKLIGWNYM